MEKGREKVPSGAPGKQLSALFGSFIPPSAAAGTYLCGWRVLAPRCWCNKGLSPCLSGEGWLRSHRAPAILGSCHPVPCRAAKALGGCTELVAVQPRNADSSTHDGADNSN